MREEELFFINNAKVISRNAQFQPDYVNSLSPRRAIYNRNTKDTGQRVLPFVYLFGMRGGHGWKWLLQANAISKAEAFSCAAA